MNSRNTIKYSKLGLQFFCVIISFLLPVNLQPTHAQTPVGERLNTREAQSNREMGLAMLEEIKKILEEYYYDPKYRGIDLKVRFQVAKDRIRTLNYNWQVYRVLAQVLLEFNDSHTRLLLPPRTDYFDYGFGVQMIGDKCFVISVKKDSDAEKKGLRVGDKVLSIGKFVPTRGDLWKIIFVLYKLDPTNTLDLKIKNLAGTETQMTIVAKTMTEKERKEELKRRKDEETEKPFKCQEISPELIACKLYTFVVEKNQIDKMMKQVGQHSKLILDLRGNGGGYVSLEEYLISYLFDRDIMIADIVTRTKTVTRKAKSRKDKSFKGELVVLVDSQTASAAEVVARVIQLEKRGKIIGDVTKGAVMTSIAVPLFGHRSALSDIAYTFTGMRVTIGDVIMKDGSRIEGAGVIPDETIGPTGLGLASRSDPVLAYAATMMGAKLTFEQAGKYYFMAEKEEGTEEPETDEQ